MLLTMYDTGVRISEITAHGCGQVAFGSCRSFVHLHGKSHKERCVPLWIRTADAIRMDARAECKAGYAVVHKLLR
jgi:integrase/recombinase XerD